VAIPSTSSLDDIDAAGTSAIDTVSKILREVAEILNDVPYVKTLSGVISQIIRIKEVRNLLYSLIALTHPI
jgi:hypothetical protein